MIKAILFEKGDAIVGFTISGHANYSNEGQDLVCCAVSTLAYTALGSVDEMIKEVLFEDDDGYMSYLKPDDLNRAQEEIHRIILEILKIGLLQIEMSYEKYLKVEIREV